MAFVNNNKKNARFNPNARDDRVLPGYVSSRRVHKPQKEAEIQEELISTDPEHVLSMEPSTRLDWFQMALMQAATGKLKAVNLYDVILSSHFAATKPLKAMVLANLHLFSPKQQKALKEVVSGSSSAALDSAKREAEAGAAVAADAAHAGPRRASGAGAGQHLLAHGLAASGAAGRCVTPRALNVSRC
eukprot:CAMPEP_0170618578 /NCGR_PEP_ID=MMETSP0224-20130122/27033_1 /TAXON_ID=285029 /ORGANISM="Togula jolla, Strain CCCM 725" /LENGTH=187 /DNA_ID=CAMNT_0010944561 /DNA_START=135 /DNA_END=699 /DNA_ORIENTATION=+